MVQNTSRRAALVLRPWFSTVSGGDAYAHFDALAMHRAENQPDHCYGNYRVFGLGDDERRTFHLDNFRFKCQIDGRHQESYAWQWGYQPANGSIFERRDMERFGPSIAAVGGGLVRCYREDGGGDGVGRFVVRIARVLKLDGIVLLETSQTGSFPDEMQIRRSIAPGEYGDAIQAIDALVLDLQRSCAQRSGRLAA